MKNYLRKTLDSLLRRIVHSASFRAQRSIPLALQRIASQTTAEYVLAKMPTAQLFKSGPHLLRFAIDRCRSQTGLVMEFGVFQGRSLRQIADSFEECVYGFDSFQGLPSDWRSDLPKGTFAVEQLPAVPANAKLVVGLFGDTVPEFLKANDTPIKFLHVDCDLYSSTIDALQPCLPRLRAGSIIVFDEYFNYPNWQVGEFKAFQELVNSTGLEYRYLGYVRSGEQVALEIVSTTKAVSADQPDHP